MGQVQEDSMPRRIAQGRIIMGHQEHALHDKQAPIAIHDVGNLILTVTKLFHCMIMTRIALELALTCEDGSILMNGTIHSGNEVRMGQSQTAMKVTTQTKC